MTTFVSPDTIEDLDYEYTPPCEMSVVKALFLPFNRYLVLGKNPPCCPNSASWCLICTYCSNEMYTCDPHRRRSDAILSCGRCHRQLHGDKAQWVEL